MQERKLLQYLIDTSDVTVQKKQEATEYLAELEEYKKLYNEAAKLRELIDAAEQKHALDGAVCTCKIMSSVIGDNHAEDCPLHYPPRQ